MSKDFTFAHGSHADYIEALYQSYQKDPESVEISWKKFFAGYDFALSLHPPVSQESAAGYDFKDPHTDRRNHAKIEALINVYRRIGHLHANLNPLEQTPQNAKDLDLKTHGLDKIDPKKKFLPANFGEKPRTFQEILKELQQTYCKNIGADFKELNDIKMVTWLQQQMEHCKNAPVITIQTKKRILQKLSQAEVFESFLQKRYLGQKRFSLEGLEALIPLLDTIIIESSSIGTKEICMGMAHRGRLNVLANIMKKPYEEMLIEFEGSDFNPFDIDGDVKYHLGFANTIKTSNNRLMDFYLLPNPSHLESINPVLEGYTRHRQEQSVGHDESIPLLLHGDASFIGQGIVAETLNLSQLKNYHTGGTIHIITNNLIGFTTNPEDSKSCSYSSDISKIIRAPVLHVNADDPESVIWVAKLAVLFRQRFHQDIVIDLVGYRRYGHNETDEPGFTQPILYKKIKQHPSALKLYCEKLIQEKSTSEEEVKNLQDQTKKELQSAYDKIHGKKTKTKRKVPPKLKHFFAYKKINRKDIIVSIDTSFPEKKLLSLGKTITNLPSDFTPHPKIKRLLQIRENMLKGKGTIDWAFAELLAFSSLIQEKYSIRLSGQDAQRGTFSSRHAILTDYQTNSPYNPLKQLSKVAKVEFINSPLSEQSCLGFEFGYSVSARNTLVLWEAQFGDFANGAQIIIDQFLVASEAKWNQTSHLVLLLPHGYEGMGPEHSNARLERFLQCSGNYNIQVCNLTTPAQYFHVLRRQMLRKYYKPLIIMSPKSLLRHPKVVSNFKDFSTNTFHEVLVDSNTINSQKVTTAILCSGKIYYDLLEKKLSNKKFQQIPLVRCEQLYPFPKEKLKKVLNKYPKLKQIKWVQEEPKNMGAWNYILPRFQDLCPPKIKLGYTGRKHSGSTAEGSAKSHQLEQNRIIDEAFSLVCAWETKQ